LTWLLALLSLLMPNLQIVLGSHTGGGGGGVSLVQALGSNDGGATGVVTLSPTSGTAGDEYVVLCGVQHADTCTITDSQSQTYSLASSLNGTVVYPSIFYKTNIAGGSDTITCTTSGSFDGIGCNLIQLHGTASSSSFDQTATPATFSSSSSLATGTTGATTAANEAAIGFFEYFGTSACSAGAAYTLPTNGNNQDATSNRGYCVVYQILTMTGAQQALATIGGGSGTGLIATFK
jgi:hypothetical protein